MLDLNNFIYFPVSLLPSCLVNLCDLLLYFLFRHSYSNNCTLIRVLFLDNSTFRIICVFRDDVLGDRYQLYLLDDLIKLFVRERKITRQFLCSYIHEPIYKAFHYVGVVNHTLVEAWVL